MADLNFAIEEHRITFDTGAPGAKGNKGDPGDGATTLTELTDWPTTSDARHVVKTAGAGLQEVYNNFRVRGSFPTSTIYDNDDNSYVTYYYNAGALEIYVSGPGGADTGGVYRIRGRTATSDISAVTMRVGGVDRQVLHTGDILDEDDFASNSATKVASQQSTKTYVDDVTGNAPLYAAQAANAAGAAEAAEDRINALVGQLDWDGIDPVSYLAQLHTNDSIGLVIRKDTDYLLTGLEARHPWGHLDPLNAAMPTVANLVSINPVSGGGAFMVRDRADHSVNSYDSIANAQTKTLLTDNGSNKIDIPIATMPNFVNGEFTIFVDVAAHSVPGADAYIFDFCDNTGNAFSKRVALRLQSSGNMVFDAYDTAVARAFQSFAGISGAAFKLAVRCKGSDWKYSLNGGAATTLSTNGAMPTGLVKFRIAQSEAGANAFAGTINNISIEPAVGLSDADLVAMTS